MSEEGIQGLTSTITLRDGHKMPIVGFGTYELDGKDAYNTVTWALEAGYRHIDSAAWYENEAECGQAILDWCARTSNPRASIFFTTKLKTNSSYDATRQAILKSLTECKLGYLDLYLIHGPIGGPTARKECWRAVCDAQKEGLIRSVGVSNYGIRHLNDFLEDGTAIPAVNQIDLHPFMTRTDIVALCKEHDIALQAWAPLVRGLRFKNSTIQKLSKKYERQPAQILLRYSLQKGYIPLPKASSKQRIVDNTLIFDFALTEDEIKELDALDEYLVTDWDPTNCA
ncbi:aldo-keto reductase [Pluteus cervinus]|uniref:Aldo-keto reductase n=1 Tax=Pluteus cervinus TaxID=181527 RepID=A0ACD3B8G6_9AGAR|nr:aldo-keto reductase [Pluteus cervinus]